MVGTPPSIVLSAARCPIRRTVSVRGVVGGRRVDTRSLFFVSFGDIWGLQWYGGISLFACSIPPSCVLLFFGFGDFMNARRALGASVFGSSSFEATFQRE